MPGETYKKYGEHLDLRRLKEELRRESELYGYLFKNNIPAYPRPELHVYHLSHSTDLTGLRGIRRDGGFKDPNPDSDQPKAVWFSLTMTPEDLTDAEARPMTLVHPGGAEEPLRPPLDGWSDLWCDDVLRAELPYGAQLQDFAKSPAFRSRSRYGSFRFTFRLSDVLDQYSQQFCGGAEPVFRVYQTVLYKQEVMYAVLVHSPDDNHLFSELPLLEDTPHCVCAYREEPQPHFVWRTQAMSQTHRFGLEEENGELVRYAYPYEKEFYVWDHVALVLHVGNEMLKFEDQKLTESLYYCNKDKVTVPLHGRPRKFQVPVGRAKAKVGHFLIKFNTTEFHINH